MRPLPTLPESKVAFFVNGQCQGVAFRDLYDFRPLRTPADARKSHAKRRTTREGTREHKENHFDDGSLGYFPLISLFNGARVRLNPGPDFAFSPPPDIDAILASDNNNNDPPLHDFEAPAASSTRTWRPLCERYAEFMEEQWALDKLEEEHARVEAAHRAVNVQAEAEKKTERERKRAHANAKKRAKRDDTAAASTPGAATATTSTGHLTPAMAYGGANTASTSTPQPEREQSTPFTEDVSVHVSTRPLIDPAAAVALPSYLLSEFHAHIETDQTSTGPSTPGPQSGYGSEGRDGEGDDLELEHEQEQEEDAPPEDLIDIYGDPTKLLQYRRAVAIRMEEEED
jgi:COMPASS component BRE2